jgi:hypothetical protein
MPGLAILANAARYRRFDSDTGAHWQAIHTRPKRRDASRKLVTDHKGLRDLVLADAAVQKIVHTRTAHTYR